MSSLRLDELTKHSPSYFSYRHFDRLYKFFQSRDYLELEKRYAHMRTLDVAKCFDSIYTHSLSWALKEKSFTKRHVRIQSTFAQNFDRLMQYANHNETNGIVIGPEVSRIFAEMIFQEVDTRTAHELRENKNLEFDKDYCFRRYVDDVFIFSKSDEISDKVYTTYSEVLQSFNLQTNSAKSKPYVRPFVTVRSRLIEHTSVEVNRFIDKFFKTGNDNLAIEPKAIHAPWKLLRSFLATIKSLCSYNSASYDDIAAYLCAVMGERIKKVVSIKSIAPGDEATRNYRDALITLLEVQFFLYRVSPSVTASYKVCTSIILAVRFVRAHFPSLESTISQKIFEFCDGLLSEKISAQSYAGESFVALEHLNVVLSLRDLGQAGLLPATTVERLFAPGKFGNYFSIVSALFYVRSDAQYSHIKDDALKAAAKRLRDLGDVHINSEKAHLLFDLLFCPYISVEKRSSWLRRANVALSLPPLSKGEIDEFFEYAKSRFVFVNWEEVDLLNSLEKKELKAVY